VKSWWKTIGIQEKLDVINWPEKGEQRVEICWTVRRAYSRIHTVCYNAARIKEYAKCIDNFKCQQSEVESVCLCSKTATVLLEWSVPESMDVSFYCVRTKYIVWKVYILFRNVYRVIHKSPCMGRWFKSLCTAEKLFFYLQSILYMDTMDLRSEEWSLFAVF
jgi:hypothetical protein